MSLLYTHITSLQGLAPAGLVALVSAQKISGYRRLTHG